MTIIPVLSPCVELLYFSDSAPVVRDVAVQNKFRYLINGSYFHGSRLNALHAGWLRVYGKHYTMLTDDRQLTHVVKIDSSKKSISFIRKEEFAADSTASTLEFQTGPLIIENGKAATEFIQSSINGLAKHRRTLMATIENSQLVLILVREKVSLDELAKYLLRLSIFKGKKLDVINLDGGSSTALYVKAIPRLNFNIEDKLPILIGVK